MRMNEWDRWKDTDSRQSDRQSDIETDRQSDRQIERQAGSRTDRQTERHDQNNKLYHTFANAPKNRIGQSVFRPIGFEVGTKEFQSVFKYFRM